MAICAPQTCGAWIQNPSAACIAYASKHAPAASATGVAALDLLQRDAGGVWSASNGLDGQQDVKDEDSY